MSVKQTTQQKLVICIDFGTTFSSVAYSVASEGSVCADEDLLGISDPKEIIFESEKQIKTELAWHPQRQLWVWGYDVDREIRSRQIPRFNRIKMFKLGLDTSDYTVDIRHQIHDQISNLPAECNVHCVDDLISIYLGFLFSYAKNNISGQHGRLHGFDIFQFMDVEWVICVPAMWTYQMNTRMRSAAVKAGIPDPQIVSEPEAAAMFLKINEQKQDRVAARPLSYGSAPCLVLDVGGATSVQCFLD